MPKVIFQLVFALNFSATATAQIAVELSKMNKLYPGLDNPLTVAVSDVPDSNLFLVPSIGKIEKTAPGKYVWKICWTDSLFAFLEIRDTVKNEFLGKFKYRMGVFPEPVAVLGRNHPSKIMGNGEYKAQGGIALVLENFDLDVKLDVEKYQVWYIKKGQNLVMKENHGARWNSDVGDLIAKAAPGDIYIFRRFVYHVPCDPQPKYLSQELIFTIK